MKYLGPTLLSLLLAQAACTFEAADIDGWQNVQNGVPRLAGYLADAKRPLELRTRAAQRLFEVDQLDYLMGVISAATPEQRQVILAPLAKLAIDTLGDADPLRADRAAALAYHLLEYAAELGDQRGPVAEALMKVALTQVPPTRRTRISADKALLGAAVAHPPVVEALIEAARETDDEDRFLALLALLGELRTPELAQRRAELLLAHARKVYPAIGEDLARAMLDDRNPTVLKFLLELTRDHQLPLAVRSLGFSAAGRLGDESIPGLLRVIRTDFPAVDDARYLALRRIWETGGPAQLGPALRALPAEGKWPTEGTEFRDDIDAFCDNRVATKAAEARPVLVELLEDPNWIARAYALRCITRLYPDEAAALVAVLAEDQTPLPGWQESGEPSSFAEAVKALKDG